MSTIINLRYGVIQDSNFILKSRSPARIVLNRGPSMSPCCSRRTPSQTTPSSTPMNHSAAAAAASSLRNPSQTPSSMSGSQQHLSRRSTNNGCEVHSYNPYQAASRQGLQQPPQQNQQYADYYDTTECEETATEEENNNNERTKTRVIRYQKRNFKYPVITDPRMLANHLAWNRSSRSAECLDESLTIEETAAAAAASVHHQHQHQHHHRPPSMTPVVARAVSPGFALAQPQQTTTTMSYMPQQTAQPCAPCRSRSYTTTTTAAQQPLSSSSGAIVGDSAYNTQSSNEDSGDSRQHLATTAAKSGSCCKGCADAAAAASAAASRSGCSGDGHSCCKGCADASASRSVYDRIRQQQQQQYEDQDESNRVVKKTNSHKV